MDLNDINESIKGEPSADKTQPTKRHDRRLIGIDGLWYDIKTFIPHHPGGNIIERFIGKDATSAFYAFHKPDLLRHRRPCSKMNEVQTEKEISQAFLQLGRFFKSEGFFELNYYWYLKKVLVSALMLMTSFHLVAYFQRSACKFLGAVALAAFWQQCGFLMHDAEHNLITQDRHIDSWLGTFFATVGFGVSGSWWRQEHFVHHAFTACIDYDTDFFDPQMREAVWAQNKKLWPFYKSRLQYYCIKIQHITFLPICILVGRIGIMIDSMKGERRLRELLAFVLHWLWMGCLLWRMESYREMLLFYSIAACLQGILHIQLLISHYSKEFHYLTDLSTSIDWYQMQVVSNIDIDTPYWLDWFHGGLNFHLVHHLYPRMPRYNYRRATYYVRELCAKHGMQYDHCGWLEAVYRTISHLKVMSTHFSLDPR